MTLRPQRPKTPNTKTVEKWREQLSGEEIFYIEVVAGSALEEYGYERFPIPKNSNVLAPKPVAWSARTRSR